MMFCPENGELALLRRVRQKSAAPCRMRLSGRREARPSPAAETPGGRFFVSILKMNFIVNIRTDLFLPPPLPRRRYGARQRAFSLSKGNMRGGGAAPPGPKRAEKHAFSVKRQAVWLEGRNISNNTCSQRKARHAARHHRLRPEALRHGRSASGKSLPRRLSAQYKSCFSRAASLRCWSQRRLFVHGAAPFLRGKKPRRSIRRRETPERTLSAVPEDVQSRRTKAQCFRLYNTSTFYDKKSGFSFTKNIRKAGKRLQKKCRRKP